VLLTDAGAGFTTQAALDTATVTMMTTTVSMIPHTDQETDCLPSCFANSGFDTAFMLATAVHATHGDVKASQSVSF